MSWTCALLLFVEFNDIGVCVEIWGRRDAERSSADQLRKGILRTEELSSRGDSGGLKGSTVTEEWVAENDRSHHSYESSLWEMWGKDEARELPRNSRTGWALRADSHWSCLRLAQPWYQTETEEEPWTHHIMHRKAVGGSLQASTVWCAPVRLGRVWLVSSWNTRWIFMTPVETERRFSFWQPLVPGAERGASRQVAQAGGSCFGQGRDLVLSFAAPGGDVVRVPSSKSHKYMDAPDSNLQHNSCNNNNISFNIYSPLRPLATCETLGWLLWKSSLINAVAFCVIYYIIILILQMWKLRHRLQNWLKMMEPYFKLRLVWFWRQLISWLTFWMPYNAYHIIQWWVCS